MSKQQGRFIARVHEVDGEIEAQPLFASVNEYLLPSDNSETLLPGSIISVGRNSKTGKVDWHLLAKPDTAQEKVWSLLDRFKLNPDFPEEVRREVEAILLDTGIDDPDLPDCTGIPFITIDNDDSTDLDQALHIGRQADGGGYIVQYALADASYYVTPGSALFAEALRRGTSFYVPEFSIPMLPRELSEGIVSLNPGVDRRALIFVMTVDDTGVIGSTKLQRGRIRSRAKLTYKGVQQYHDAPERSELSAKPYTETLDLLGEVGELRLMQFRERDVVEYQRIEMEIRYANPAGSEFHFSRDVRLPVDRWNEQISLMCNTEGARLLIESESDNAGLQALFRVHEPPAVQQLDKLQQLIRQITNIHDLDPAVWHWRRSADDHESLADYLFRLPKTEEGVRVRSVIERQALLVNRAAVYSGERGVHHALKVTAYARFSSPMREIAGIFTHKEALEKYSNSDFVNDPKQDEVLREEVIQSASRAKSVQRKLTKAVYKLVIDQVLHNDLGKPIHQRPLRSAIILGLSSSRLYLRLDHPPLEVKVYTRNLESRFSVKFKSDRQATMMTARSRPELRYRVGDTVRLRTHDYDEENGKWLLLPE